MPRRLHTALLFWYLAGPLAFPADPVISEFMADNRATLADEDGAYSDWIEIRNPDAGTVSLEGWSLTDDAGAPTKWAFPAVSLPPRGTLLVFASGKDRRVPGQPLHTNFDLLAAGEYLALVKPDGLTVAQAFSPIYPPQVVDVSFGYPVQATTQTLVSAGTALSLHVPADDALGTNWTQPGFDDSGWTPGLNGVGYQQTFTNSSPGATYAARVLQSAPLGYWRLEEAGGTVATNLGSLASVVNAGYHAGTQLGLEGPRPAGFPGLESTNRCAGATSGAWQIVAPDHASFDFGTGPFSLEMWFYPANASSRGDLFTYKGTGGDFGIHVGANGANTLSLYHDGLLGTSAAVVTNLTWHHLVVTRNTGGQTQAYLNGNLILSVAHTRAMNIASPLLFGSNHSGTPTNPAILFYGRIDEPAVYGRELPFTEVRAHYQRGLGFDPVFPAPDEDVAYQPTIASASPLGYWRLNETNGVVAVNEGSLGSLANGSFNGGVTLGQSGPVPPLQNGFPTNNLAAGFAGTTQVLIPDGPHFDFGTGPFAIEMWFFPTQPAVRGDLFTLKGTGGDFGIHLASQTANRISLYHNGFIGGAAGSVTASTWNHLVVTRTPGGMLNAYLNGTLILGVADAQPLSVDGPLLFGSNHSGTPTAAAIVFQGRIDDAAVYNREVPAAEALLHYRRGVGAPVSFAGHFNTDVDALLRGVNPGLYLRIPFSVVDPSTVDRLRLRLKYDDGVAAYVNGLESISLNAPTPLAWDSAATGPHPDSDAVVYQEIELDETIASLQAGSNLLALHGLNRASTNVDFLCTAELSVESHTAQGNLPVYLLAPTPDEPNTGSGTPGARLTEATHLPMAPTDGDDLVVTVRAEATLHSITSVSLNYRVMYGSTNTVTMADDGLHGDGGAGDGVYGGVIPASAALPGEMIRWTFTATDTAANTSRWPLFASSANTPNWLGTVVRSVTSNLPVWEWFAENTAAARNAAGTRGAVWFNGEFYDNVFMRARGAATSGGSQKFDFNPGDHCYINPALGRVDEVNLNTSSSDVSLIRPPLAFEAYRRTGHPACEAFHMVLRANGAADRVGYYVEQVDDNFLRRNDLDPEGALYKFIERGATGPVFTNTLYGVEKKTRKTETFADLNAFVAGLNHVAAADRRTWFFDNVNVPSLLNLLAVSRVTQDSDDVRKNFYLFRDTNGNGEWSIFPWDKDWTFGILGDGPPHLYHPFFGDAAHPKTSGNQWNILWDFVFNDPVVQPLFLRRLRTVMDDELQPPGTVNGLFEQRARAWMDALAPNVSAAVTNQLPGVLDFFPGRRTGLYQTYSTASGVGADALIPDAQPTEATIRIGDIDFSPSTGNQDMEYIQLVNTNTYAVDISGWRLTDAVSMTFDPGTVIPAGGMLYASPDSAAFRARPTGPTGGQQLQVQDRYNGHLSSFGETITLVDRATNTVDSLAYPGDPSDAQEFLVISEIHYNPPSADDLEEFVEILNISTNLTLDLQGIVFTNGLRFAFSGGAVTNLAPGARALLVRNPTAFSAAFGPGLPVAGTFTGSLDNGGEPLKWEDAQGGTIQEFAYNDTHPWPMSPDGLGASLVLINPATRPDPALPSSWRASPVPSPGETDATAYAAWKTSHGITDDQDDSDADGLSALLEYTTGSDPATFTPDGRPVATRTADGYLLIEVPLALRADDVETLLLQSPQPDTGFLPSTAEWVSRAVSGERELRTYRLPFNAVPERLYFRVKYTLRE